MRTRISRTAHHRTATHQNSNFTGQTINDIYTEGGGGIGPKGRGKVKQLLCYPRWGQGYFGCETIAISLNIICGWFLQSPFLWSILWTPICPECRCAPQEHVWAWSTDLTSLPKPVWDRLLHGNIWISPHHPNFTGKRSGVSGMAWPANWLHGNERWNEPLSLALWRRISGPEEFRGRLTCYAPNATLN